mmetsp:Transcript_29570/g.59703  ORF Transcript_29570/g.59703 Transcript_29570/m.59703 type:complete len:226 (+) Transcript_29570:253-930(+)
MTIRALASSRQDFLKQTKQPKASAVSSSKVLSGSGGFGLNLEDQAGTQQETVMSQCAAEGFEVEYKLAEQSTKAAELHEMQQDIRALDGCFRDLGTLLAQQGDVIDSIEEDVEKTATRIPKGTTELAAAGKAKCSPALATHNFALPCATSCARVVLTIADGSELANEWWRVRWSVASSGLSSASSVDRYTCPSHSDSVSSNDCLHAACWQAGVVVGGAAGAGLGG